MKLLDTLYTTLVKGPGSISIDDFHDVVLGVKDKTEDSLSLVASIITMDGRFIFDGDKIILKAITGSVDLDSLVVKKEKLLTKRLLTSNIKTCEMKIHDFRQTHVMDATYVVFDFETTGLSPKYHKVIEIGATKISKCKVVDKFHSFVDPETYIPKFITDLTGITSKMVEGAPDYRSAFSQFYDFLSNSIIVAHNLSFDYKFLKYYLDKIGLPMPHTGLCTMKLAKRFLKDFNLKSVKLQSLAQYFEINVEKGHRAYEDACTTSKIFLNFLEIAERNSICTVNKLHDYQSLSLKEI